MSADLFAAVLLLWLVALAFASFSVAQLVVRCCLSAGCAVGVVACILALPNGLPETRLSTTLSHFPLVFALEPGALWLLGFGLFPAGFACALGSPKRTGSCKWHAGAAVSLIGALGVFGMQDGLSLLVSWELMSLGGALMLCGEWAMEDEGKSVLFMLSLLEAGAVALLLGVLVLDAGPSAMGYANFIAGSSGLSTVTAWIVGLALLIGFGAKLGLLPFYEWFPRAYGSGSGATGAILSGVVLNAAFFALSRGWDQWIGIGPQSSASFGLGVIAIGVGVVSAILAVLFAFQQDDWRTVLSYSSAENASVAVTMLGVSVLFRSDDLNALAGLAWTVALLHLAGHSLAKGALFLVADGIYLSSGSYDLVQHGWIKRCGLALGVGAVFAAMSLASIPPQAGFVSEWYVFQSVFQGFHLSSFGGRLALVLAGAGLALAAAVALATFVKLIGVGMLGAAAEDDFENLPRRTAAAVGILGICVLAVAVGAPLWLNALAVGTQTIFHANAPAEMVKNWLLVPLTDKFAFISPSKLIIVMPLLSLIPLLLLFVSRRYPVARVPIWFGGTRPRDHSAATTPLTFSNAMRTFYSFVYQPTTSTEREHEVREYFIKRLVFSHDVTDLFDRHLFLPATHIVQWCARKLRALQSGNLNFYLALIGGLLVTILALTLR